MTGKQTTCNLKVYG